MAATVDTAHKAPLIVAVAGAAEGLPKEGITVSFDPPGIAAIEDGPGPGLWVAGIAPGTTVLTASALGSSVTLEVTVTESAVSLWAGFGPERLPRFG